MLINNGNPKEPKYDTRAGRQIFDREYGHREYARWATVPKDTTNPIDIKLRQLAIEGEPVDLKALFFNINCAFMHQFGQELKIIKGKIKDLFFHSRDVYIKTRKGEVYIVPFDKVIELSETEI